MDDIVLLVEMCCNFTFIVNYAFARRFQNVHLLIEGFVSENVKIQSIYKKSTYYLKIITYNKNNKFIYHNPKRRFTNQFSVLNRFRFHNNYLRHYLPLHYPHHWECESTFVLFHLLCPSRLLFCRICEHRLSLCKRRRRGGFQELFNWRLTLCHKLHPLNKHLCT